MSRREQISVIPFSRDNVTIGDTYFIRYRGRAFVSFKVVDVDSKGFSYDNPPIYASFPDAEGLILRISPNGRGLEIVSNVPVSLRK